MSGDLVCVCRLLPLCRALPRNRFISLRKREVERCFICIKLLLSQLIRETVIGKPIQRSKDLMEISLENERFTAASSYLHRASPNLVGSALSAWSNIAVFFLFKFSLSLGVYLNHLFFPIFFFLSPLRQLIVFSGILLIISAFILYFMIHDYFPLGSKIISGIKIRVKILIWPFTWII